MQSPHYRGLWSLRFRGRLVWLTGLLLAAGCASGPYQYGRFHAEGVDPPPLVVEHGGPHERLDKLKSIVEFPSKLIPFKKNKDQPEPTLEDVEAKAVAYLEKNDLTDVYVAVNDYDPGDQWRRLKENQRIAPGWRYTLGTLSVVGYTLIPGRVFSSDSYNPYTNTLSLNSTKPAAALSEAAWAKDTHSHKYAGTYVALTSVPGLSIVRSVKRTQEVVGYLRAEEEWETEKQAYPLLYAQVGSDGAGLAGSFVTTGVGPLLRIGGGLVGGAAGRVAASQRSREIELVKAERQRLRETGFFDDIQLGGPAVDGVMLAAGTGSPDDGQVVPPEEAGGEELPEAEVGETEFGDIEVSKPPR